MSMDGIDVSYKRNILERVKADVKEHLAKFSKLAQSRQ